MLILGSEDRRVMVVRYEGIKYDRFDRYHWYAYQTLNRCNNWQSFKMEEAYQKRMREIRKTECALYLRLHMTDKDRKIGR